MKQLMMSKTFNGTKEIDEGILKINTYRNIFIHFTPKGYKFLPSGMPKLFLTLLDYVNFLGIESGNIYWRKTERKRFTVVLSKAYRIFKTLDKKYSQFFKANKKK
jgi:hypothetical protein